VDLTDLSSMESDGMKWILTGIDTFSKMAFGVPLPNKTEAVVLKGMKKMLD